jgi:hypothetical protein
VFVGVFGVVITLADRLSRPPSVAALLWALLGLAGLVSGTMLRGRLRIPAGPASLASVELAVSTLVLAFFAPFAGSLAIPWTLRAMVSFGWGRGGRRSRCALAVVRIDSQARSDSRWVLSEKSMPSP